MIVDLKVPLAEVGGEKRPKSVFEDVPVTSPETSAVPLLENEPSAPMPTLCAVHVPVNVPPSPHGALTPMFKPVISRPLLETSNVTGSPCDVAPT